MRTEPGRIYSDALGPGTGERITSGGSGISEYRSCSAGRVVCLGSEKWSGAGLMGCTRAQFLRCLITADRLERAEIFKAAHALRPIIDEPPARIRPLRAAACCFPFVPPHVSTELYLSNRCAAWSPTVLPWSRYIGINPAQLSSHKCGTFAHVLRMTVEMDAMRHSCGTRAPEPHGSATRAQGRCT
jgi:hypothetical protein